MSKEPSKTAGEQHVKAGTSKVSALGVFKQPLSPVGLEIKMYAVRNSKGQWFQAKGRDSYNKKTWVDELEKAKFYTKIGQARARVTFFANNNPHNLPPPEIVELTASVTAVLNENDRLGKVVKAKKLEEERRKNREIQEIERELKLAQEELERIKTLHDELRRSNGPTLDGYTRT
jgi:hypothetical protein